jgi:RHS repeat-associated protein
LSDDGATVNGATMQNAKGRLAEAYTAAGCPNSTKTTDLGFSYSVRGELADVYESTLHSGGYYHATASYWANGALNVLNPLNSTALPTFTYSADNEGRPSAVTASAGTNPVSNTAYNVASQPTGLTFGTADTDAFSFDSNTGRMTQYQFTVGSTPKTVTGQLGWNANGTLASLGITDQFNSANTQSCTYSHDDLGRVSSVNCGSVWSQTFGFDPFGNLTKSGSVSFQPTYNASTNRMSSLPGYTPTYDANGNTTADSLHAYAWDVEGRASTIDSVSLTYDALGRMVEQQSGSSYTEILYGPTGKLALMSGQTVSKAFIPLTAGATAVYASGPTLSYFRHPDWLGSSRFASTASRTMYYSVAYAPFGETYAEAGTPDRSFTGQNQDTVSGSTAGLYHFMFREYAQYGRWISPDPAGLAAVSLVNPQSWNRYAYVLNDPCSLVDPLGLDTCKFNVQLNLSGGPSLGKNDVAKIETSINAIFGRTQSDGNSVGITFNFQGDPDISLRLWNVPGWLAPTLAEYGIFGCEGFVCEPTAFYNVVASKNFPVGTLDAVAIVSGHELAHGLLNQPDQPYNSGNPNILMMNAANLSPGDNPFINPNASIAKLSLQQVQTLYKQCTNKPQATEPTVTGGWWNDPSIFNNWMWDLFGGPSDLFWWIVGGGRGWEEED